MIKYHMCTSCNQVRVSILLWYCDDCARWGVYHKTARQPKKVQG